MNSPMGAFSFLGQDASVLKKKVKPGTALRTLAFAVPYSGLLALFLLIVILGAGISIASPLIYRQIINDGIHLSAVVGSRMVLSLRPQLFSHIQQMPLAFFTRTQTGALVNRLNTEALGTLMMAGPPDESQDALIPSFVRETAGPGAGRSGPRGRH